MYSMYEPVQENGISVQKMYMERLLSNNMPDRQTFGRLHRLLCASGF